MAPGDRGRRAFLAILECTIDKGSMDDSGIVYFTGGLGIAWLSGWLLRRQAALTAQMEAMREAQAEQVAATERARIAERCTTSSPTRSPS